MKAALDRGPQLHFRQTGGTFDPAKHFFDAFATALADVLADVAVVRHTTAVLRRLPVFLRCRPEHILWNVNRREQTFAFFRPITTIATSSSSCCSIPRP